MGEDQGYRLFNEPAHRYFSIATRGQSKRRNGCNSLISLYQADLRIQQVDGLAARPCYARLGQLLVDKLLVGIVGCERDEGLPVYCRPPRRDAVKRSILVRANHHQRVAKAWYASHTGHSLENAKAEIQFSPLNPSRDRALTSIVEPNTQIGPVFTNLLEPPKTKISPRQNNSPGFRSRLT